MRQSHVELYQQLLNLANTNDAFYFVDQEKEGVNFRIFLYRLASYTDFMQPGAIESRGITFEMNKEGQPVFLACRPFEKFFNLGENPLTMDLDLGTTRHIFEKLDGSLISTIPINGKAHFKTKGSLHSEQAQAAMALLATPKFYHLERFIQWYGGLVCTLNFEYTAPDNRIVIGYSEPSLTLLSIRDNMTGEYWDYDRTKGMMRTYGCDEFLVKVVDAPNAPEFIQSVANMQGVEGYVIWLQNGLKFKVKADAYVALHKTKDNINSPRNLYEACVNGASDDLRGLFKTDPWCLDRINAMETHVYKHFNHVMKTIDEVYAANKDLDRKSYAIKTKAEVPEHLFGLMMSKYLGREIDLKGFMIKNWPLYKPDDIQEVTGE